MMNKYDLNSVEWGEFKIKDFFKVQNTTPYHWNNIWSKWDWNKIAYITRTASNNWLEDVISGDFSLNENDTISFWAESAAFFYQPYNYVVWNKMYKLSKQWLNKYSLLFLVQVFQKSIIWAWFWYGKWLTGTRFKERFVMLPKNSSWNPDWNFMEKFMQYQEQKLLKKYIEYTERKTW